MLDRRVEVFTGRDAALRLDPISAYGLMRREKVQVIEMFDPPLLLRSPSVQIEIPRTMALLRWVPHPAPRIRAVPSRVDVLDRDEWVCQYCLSAATTIDHVRPRARGGPHTWENLVAACGQCNEWKGCRTPREAGMDLIRRPRRPLTLSRR